MLAAINKQAVYMSKRDMLKFPEEPDPKPDEVVRI